MDDVIALLFAILLGLGVTAALGYIVFRSAGKMSDIIEIHYVETAFSRSARAISKGSMWFFRAVAFTGLSFAVIGFLGGIVSCGGMAYVVLIVGSA